MPTRPLTQEQMQQALDALEKYGSVAKAARATGLNRLTLSSRIRAARERAGLPRAEPGRTQEAKFDVELRAKRFLVTAAQNATPVNEAFLASLETAARVMKAQIIVVPIRYKNPTSLWTQSQDNDEVWDPRIATYLCNTRKYLHPHLILLGDVKTQATASQPLTGLESLTHNESGILGHTRLQFRAVPTPRNRMPKILTTTGAVTLPNYTDTKLGKKGEFHHTHGACLVELDGDRFHIRQINAISDGTFIDLNVEYTPTGSRPAPPAAGIVFGDTHVDFIDPMVAAATYGRHGIVETLAPRHLIWNDLLDGYARNPHHQDNVFNEIAKRTQDRHLVGDEVARAAAFLRKHTPSYATSVIVSSNHDDFLARWVRDTDWRKDPDNARFYLETAQVMVGSTRLGPGGMEGVEPFGHWMQQWCAQDIRLKCLRRDESFEVAGIECGFHGDRGPNGSRGSLKNFRAIGPRVVIGHSHSPGIEQGAYQTGTSTYLTLEYTSGPSSWLQTHCVIYANGKRSLLSVINGKWRKA